MKRSINIGIIGLGNISRVHIRALKAHPAVSIRAVADSDPARLRDNISGIKGVHTYTDYHALLDDQMIDAVDILLPHFLHATVIKESIRAGKHVICEKPLVTDVRDIPVIARESKREKKRVYPKQYFQFSLLHQKVRNAILKGVIGKPYFVSCTYTTNDGFLYDNPFSWRGNKKEAGGGVWMDVGTHIVDYLDGLFGNPIEVSAVMENKFSLLPEKGEDMSVVTLTYPQRITASIVCLARDTSYGFRWEKHFYGSEGAIHVTDMGKARMDMDIVKNSHTVYSDAEKNWWEHANTEALHDIINRIVNDEPASVSLQETKRMINTVQAAYTSARLHKTVML